MKHTFLIYTLGALLIAGGVYRVMIQNDMFKGGILIAVGCIIIGVTSGLKKKKRYR